MERLVKDLLRKRGEAEREREPKQVETDFEKLSKRKQPVGVCVDNPAWRRYMRHHDVWEGEDDAD